MIAPPDNAMVDIADAMPASRRRRRPTYWTVDEERELCRLVTGPYEPGQWQLILRAGYAVFSANNRMHVDLKDKYMEL